MYQTLAYFEGLEKLALSQCVFFCKILLKLLLLKYTFYLNVLYICTSNCLENTASVTA